MDESLQAEAYSPGMPSAAPTGPGGAAAALHAVAGAASGVLQAETREALHAVLEAACRQVVPFDAFFIQEYDAATHTFHGFGGCDAGRPSPPDVTPAAGTPGERVVGEGQTLVTRHADDPAGQGGHLTGTGRRSESVIRAPIRTADGVLGVLSVHSYTPDRYTPADVEVVEVFASLAATAFVNARLAAGRRAAEAALRRVHEELEKRVAARTAELAERTAELAQAEQRFRAIVEASPTPLMLSRLEDGVVLYGNDRLEALVGVPPGSLVGRRTPDFYYDPADRPGVVAAAQAQGYVRDLELRIRRADGTPRWVALSVQRLVFNGEPAIATALIDITERKEAEAALWQRTQELEAIFRALPDLYFRMAADGTILDYRAGRAFGLYVPPEAFLGQRVQEVLPPPVGPRIAEALGEVARTRELVLFEYMLPLGDERRDFEARLLPLPDGQVVAVVRDVTERVQGEEALRASEASYRGLFDHLTELVYVQDLDGRFLNVNEAVVRAYGYPREAFIGNTPAFLAAPGTVDPEVFAATFERAVAGEPQRFEWWGRRHDGSHFLKEVVLKRSTYFGQDVVIAVARDISARVEAEAALRLQTALLQAQGEASIDGFLVVSQAGRILSFNQRFLDMWGLAPAVMAQGTRAAVLAALVAQLDDPAAYVARADALYANPHEEARDEIRLRDGRVFDRYSAPVVGSDGDHYGRIWFYRDVTAQTRHAAELEQAREEAEAAREEAEAAREEASHYAASLERELAFGRQIQQGLFPAVLPQPEGWDVAVRFRPVWQVAGDFYDAFTLPSGRVGLLIADVSGKGVGAALFMTLFQSLLRAAAERASRPRDGHVPDDEAVLREAFHATNDYVTRVHRHAHMFASAFFGLLDPATGTVRYVNAGHEPPAVVTPAGIVERLRPTGPALGLLREATYAVAATRLAPGAFLLAYTDGVTEARSADRAFFTEERLLALLTPPAATAAALLDRIEEAVRAFAGEAPPSDDLTLLALRRAG